MDKKFPHKLFQLRDWKRSHPGKIERDWLLETRCSNNKQREDLKKLFEWIDARNASNNSLEHVQFIICPWLTYEMDITSYEPSSVQKSIDPNLPKEDVILFFDFSIEGNLYDLDTPQEIYLIKNLALASTRYFEWKAKEIGGLEHTTFIFDGKQKMGDFPIDWKLLPKKFPINEN